MHPNHNTYERLMLARRLKNTKTYANGCSTKWRSQTNKCAHRHEKWTIILLLDCCLIVMSCRTLVYRKVLDRWFYAPVGIEQGRLRTLTAILNKVIILLSCVDRRSTARSGTTNSFVCLSLVSNVRIRWLPLHLLWSRIRIFRKHYCWWVSWITLIIFTITWNIYALLWCGYFPRERV